MKYLMTMKINNTEYHLESCNLLSQLWMVLTSGRDHHHQRLEEDGNNKIHVQKDLFGYYNDDKNNVGLIKNEISSAKKHHINCQSRWVFSRIPT